MTEAAERPSPWPGGGEPAPAPPPPDPTAEIAAPDADRLSVDCVATRPPLFWLALRTGALTVLTLGLYRFWMKTRLRRWYWSSVRPGGLPLEYVGEPMEKLLGFLVAVVILAFYIGIVNLGFAFASLTWLDGAVPALLLSLIGVIPLWFYATYRARRYVLARTRWRGLRFGLEPGAWGYALRALGHWTATLLSVGLLWPRMTFGLEKYRTDRTRYGDTPLVQGGEWKMLWPAFVHVIIGAVFSAGALAVGLTQQPGMLWLLLGSGPWLLYGIVHYRVEATRLMANAKAAGPLRLDAAPRPARVLRIYLFGGIAALIVLSVPLTIVGMGLTWAEMTLGEAATDLPQALLIAGAAVLYISLALTWSTLRHVFLTMPVWRHYAETLAVTGTADLGQLRQVERDALLQAEGFAEALDVGAAI